MLESRIVKLNGTINYSRRGLRNTFKSWMRRPKQAGPVTSADVAGMPSVLYPHTSIEAQIRVLADLAFMLQVRKCAPIAVVFTPMMF